MKIEITEGKMDFLICNRYSVKNTIDLVNLAVIKWHHGQCSKCLHKVTYSEASKILLEQNPDLPLVCLDCAMVRLQSNPEGMKFVTTPKHMMEVEQIRLAKMRRKN